MCDDWEGLRELGKQEQTLKKWAFTPYMGLRQDGGSMGPVKVSKRYTLSEE